MIGWNHVWSRDYAEAVVNGLVDDDLERMSTTIQERIKDRDGTPRCPECGGLLEETHVHGAEGKLYTVTPGSPV